MKNETKSNFLSGFLLKIIGMITMTFDHIGIVLYQYPKLSIAFRCVGRLAFPIFIFLLVEGVRHTRNYLKYFLRVFSIALMFAIGQLFIRHVMKYDVSMLKSPMIDLVFTSLIIYFLNRKDKLSFLAIPIFLYVLFDQIVTCYQIVNPTSFNWFLVYLRTSYGILGPILGIGFYYAPNIAKFFLKINPSTRELANVENQNFTNVISAFVLVLCILSFYLLSKIEALQYLTNPVETYACISAIFLLLYSGKRGYNATWYKYFSYLYMPLHILLIAVIFII